MSLDEFHLFSTYSYLFGNKHTKSKLSISRVFLMYELMGLERVEAEVLKYLIVRVSSLWLCITNSSKHLVTCSCIVVLALYHLNSVVSVVRGPLYCNTKIVQDGLRNSLLIAPMPTVSTSQTVGFNWYFELSLR